MLTGGVRALIRPLQESLAGAAGKEDEPAAPEECGIGDNGRLRAHVLSKPQHNRKNMELVFEDSSIRTGGRLFAGTCRQKCSYEKSRRPPPGGR